MKETLLNIYKKIRNKILERKILSIVLGIILIFIIYKYFFTSSTVTTTYTTAEVSREIIISYISETGQVSANGSIDLKSSVSGKINSIRVSPGDFVKAGQIIATVESSNAYASLESAKLSYQNAKLSYTKATSPASLSSILSAQNSLQNSSSSLAKAYNDSLSNISSTYSDISTMLSYLHDALYLSDLNSSQYNMFFYSDTVKAIESKYSLPLNAETYTNDTNTKYNLIKDSYSEAFAKYQSLSYSSSGEELYLSLQKASLISRNMSDAIKSTINLIQYYQDLNSKYDLNINSKSLTYLNNLKNYQNTINSDLSAINSLKSSIDNLKLSILQQQTTLNDLQNGVSGLDLESAEISMNQARINYEVSLNNYNNYFITSPIDGKVGTITGTLGGEASGAAIATIVTDSKFVNISVSENDIVKMKLGQKATITFDAIDDLTLVGTISQINETGLVSSGIVSYGVKIAFNDLTDKVRTGMSATANIVVDVATDVLAVPNGAVKSSTSITYVDTFNSTSSLVSNNIGTYTSSILPTRKTVTTGIVGDSYTEIISGLQEGNVVVTKTNTPSATSKTTTTNSTQNSSRNGGGVGGIRF